MLSLIYETDPLLSDEVSGNVDVGDLTAIVEDHEQVGCGLAEADSYQHELLFATLMGDHGVFDLAETTRRQAELGPFAFQVSGGQLFLQLQRHLGSSCNPAPCCQIAGELDGRCFDRLDPVNPLPGQ